MKHKHADLIKAWADGARIEIFFPPSRSWMEQATPVWLDWKEYRIKLEPKPDVVRYGSLIYYDMGFDGAAFTADVGPYDNIKATFDGETSKLKSIELIK